MNSRRWKVLIAVVLLLVAGRIGYALLALRGTFATKLPLSQAHGEAVAAGSSGHLIVGRFYLSGAANPAAPLVVVLHGDAPFVNPGYQYVFAANVAEGAPGTRVVGLMRPGYTDVFGEKSDGDRGFASGENYTPSVIADMATAIRQLQSQWSAPSVILIGHSGGAAIAANIAALNPGLIQHVFLVGCPCDVPAFRHHMARYQFSPFWLIPVHSLSPEKTLESMQPGTEISAISGSADPITLPQYAEVYVTKAKAQGLTASMTMIPGKGHEILLEPPVLEAVTRAIQNHP